MRKNNQRSYPVSHSRANQTKVRLIAFFVFFLASVYCAFPHWGIAGILLVDFSCRAFRLGNYSLLGGISDVIISKFRLPVKTTNAAPKEFAAMLGFILCDVLFIVSCLQLYSVGFYIAAILVCFGFLEAVFDVCAGCYVFPYFRKMLATSKREEIISA